MSAVATQDKGKGQGSGSGAHRRPMFKSFFSTLRHKRPSNTAITSDKGKNGAVNTSVGSPVEAEASRSVTSLAASEDSSLGADTDASIRPITPVSSVSHRASTVEADRASSSSLSNFSSATQAKSTASTKPTTLFSVHSDNDGHNRIAQNSNPSRGHPQNIPLANLATTSTPPHGSAASMRPPSLLRRQGSDVTTRTTASISFSALPPTPSHSSNSPVAPIHNTSSSSPHAVTGGERRYPGQAPYYSAPNPKYNPHPSSPALDNASMVTLASSTGGHAGTIAEDKADKMSVIADEDASVRALPPSRRASDTSLASRMSYAAGANPNPWAKRPASLLTVATGASDLKLDRDSKRKSGATTHTEATDPDHHSQHEKEEIQSTTLQDDEEAASLKTAPTSPINETSIDPLQFMNHTQPVEQLGDAAKPQLGIRLLTPSSASSVAMDSTCSHLTDPFHALNSRPSSSSGNPPSSAQTEKAPTPPAAGHTPPLDGLKP